MSIENAGKIWLGCPRVVVPGTVIGRMITGLDVR
jgi:hypothetical protein